jgi:hypothetical protein
VPAPGAPARPEAAPVPPGRLVPPFPRPVPARAPPARPVPALPALARLVPARAAPARAPRPGFASSDPGARSRGPERPGEPSSRRARSSSVTAQPPSPEPISWVDAFADAPVNALRAATSGSGPQREDVRRRPTLPRGPPRSTIGAEGLNFRVRNGTGCFPFAMAAETLWRCQVWPTAPQEPHSGRVHKESRSQATRPISTGQLHALPRFHLRPINPVV